MAKIMWTPEHGRIHSKTMTLNIELFPPFAAIIASMLHTKFWSMTVGICSHLAKRAQDVRH